jgi:hypothetical protein
MALGDVLSLPGFATQATLTTSATAWVPSPWGVVGTPSASAPVYLIGIVVMEPPTPALDVTHSSLIEIGTGATGSEVVKVQIPFTNRDDSVAEHFLSTMQGGCPFFFPEAVEIPANTQLSWRVACSEATARGYTGFALFYREGAAPAAPIPDLLMAPYLSWDRP